MTTDKTDPTTSTVRNVDDHERVWPTLHRVTGEVLRLLPGEEAELAEKLEHEVSHLEIRKPKPAAAKAEKVTETTATPEADAH